MTQITYRDWMFVIVLFMPIKAAANSLVVLLRHCEAYCPKEWHVDVNNDIK